VPTPLPPPAWCSAAVAAHAEAPAWGPAGALAWVANDHAQKTLQAWLRSADGAARPLVAARSPQPGALGFTVARGGSSFDVAFDPTGRSGPAFVASDGPGLDLDVRVQGFAAPVAAARGADLSPTVSTDGAWLWWSSARSGGGDLYRLAWTTPGATPQAMTRTDARSEWDPSLRADGAAVFTSRGEAGADIGWLPTPGAAPALLVDRPGDQTRPRWAPDGHHIAFYSDEAASPRVDLIVRTPDGRLRTLLSGVRPDTHGPAWAPDGRSLFVVAADPTQLDPVVRVFLDGQPPVALALGSRNHGDLAVAAAGEGRIRLAVATQSPPRAPAADWKRLCVWELPATRPP
jgi:hypothetical protein